jgi:hypothetical protein
VGLAVALLTVKAAVGLPGFIGQKENVGQLLFDGSDTAGIFTVQYVGDLPGKAQRLFFDDFIIPDNINRDIMVDESQDIQVNLLETSLDLDDILSAHFIAAGIFDDSHLTVDLIQSQMTVNLHGFACLDMIQNDAFFQAADI